MSSKLVQLLKIGSQEVDQQQKENVIRSRINRGDTLLPLQNHAFHLIRAIFCLSLSLHCLSSLRIAQASLQARKQQSFLPVKPCDKPCFNGGTCMDGACVCPPGWTGPQCDNCAGRVRKKASQKGFLTDGPAQYSASAKCIWIIENDRPGPLLLRLEDFFTECCWDYLYVYDGDGVYDNLIGAFSGSLTGVEIVAKSGQAIIYFISDLAFNLPGFNMSYERGLCPNNCTNHGRCLSSGRCDCEAGFKGEFCQNQVCLVESNENLPGPCQNRAVCKKGKCGCTKNAHGDHCQELLLEPVWDTVVTLNEKFFEPRASHKAVLIAEDQTIWVFGGFLFNEKPQKSNELVVLNLNDRRFRTIKATNTPPSPRYDHSLVYRSKKLYVFGGVMRDSLITNEFWSLDMDSLQWTMLSSHNDSPIAMPMAVAGHSAHVIGDEMHVLFGYNPYEGYVYRPQIYSFETGRWRKGGIDPAVLGRFGHAAVIFEEADKNHVVLVHGGYNAPLNTYSYSISDELLLYNPGEQTWTSLGNSGLSLFRHTAVLLDGIMLVMGGNSHNESSTVQKTKCYSNQILAFDTMCKKWLKISSKEFQAIGRFGQEAVANEEHVFVLGGFNGQMLNDVLKFTPAECDVEATSAEECENSANGIRCVFYNKTCTKTLPNASLRQSFLSFIKTDSPRMFQVGCGGEMDTSNTCLNIKECADCVLKKGCAWCEASQMCQGAEGGSCGEDGIIEDRTKCPFGGKKRKNMAKPRPCSLATNCFACRQLKHCTWFTIETKHICVSLADEAVLIEEHNKIQAEKLGLVVSSSAVFATPQSPTSLASVAPPATLNPGIPSPPDGKSDMVIPLSTANNRPNNTCPMPCFMHKSCQSCVGSQCMWCPSTRRCVSMDTYMISFPYGQCQSWVTAANSNHACQLDPYDCELQKTCSECQLVGPRCGWCDDGSGTGLGRCVAGTDFGPLEKDACAPARWFFTGEPTCQCNGHSTCTENTTSNRKCRQCADKTRGDHCEICELGYFGDPRNGGMCRECQCNGQATLCHPETGDCYCSTKGVTGPHCDRCEPKYVGDPKSNRACTYELVIDFIFTFKLDGDDVKDKYVNQINFFSMPFKRDTDVQFSVVCEGESGAKVSINLSTNLVEGRLAQNKQLMAGQMCTSNGIKRTYSSADPGYAFGTEANTTFFVRVSDFTTPIKIQISFAQSPPINWVLFFVIFAACFIILLVVAGLLWMIKLRIEWYRNIRRRHDEIEEMASRPFAGVQLDTGGDPSTSQPTPISIEPCSNYQAGVYTLIVRLPTGGQPYTPHGTSGLAIASSLCQLTQAQLALLQPPDTEKKQNRKSAIRKLFIRP